MHVMIQSPLPPADFLNAYKSIDPSAPKMLLDEFIKQADHRMAN